MGDPLVLELKKQLDALETNVTNLLVANSAGTKTLNDSYKNYKKIVLKVRNAEQLPKVAIMTIPVASISNTEIYVVSAFQDTTYNISASVKFTNENTVQISEIKNSGWTFRDIVIDGLK